jgi:hypothetical protein
MNRPIITEFLGDGLELYDVQKKYLECIELYNYMQALDTYIDYMEENFIPNESKTVNRNENAEKVLDYKKVEKCKACGSYHEDDVCCE